MKFSKSARIGAAMALLALTLPLSALPAAAAGRPAMTVSVFGAFSDPLMAIARMVGEIKSTVADWKIDPVSLRTVLADQVHTAAFDIASLRRADKAPATTGSVETTSTPVGKVKQLKADLLASVAIPFGRLPALTRMEPIQAEIDAGIFNDCRTVICENARATLETVVQNGRRSRFLDMVSAVNRSVNRLVAYRRDRDIHGVVDYWAKPSQTLNTGIGDCEDYAILKMAVLASAGVPTKSMSLVVLRDERRGVYHAVLAIRTSRGSFILDNLDSAVRQDVEFPDYMPLYSISGGRGYIYGRRSGRSTLSASAAKFDAIAPGEGLDANIPDPRAAFFVESAGMRGPL